MTDSNPSLPDLFAAADAIGNKYQDSSSNVLSIDLHEFEDFARDLIDCSVNDQQFDSDLIPASVLFPVIKNLIQELTEDLVINPESYITPRHQEALKKAIDDYLHSQLPSIL